MKIYRLVNLVFTLLFSYLLIISSTDRSEASHYLNLKKRSTFPTFSGFIYSQDDKSFRRTPSKPPTLGEVEKFKITGYATPKPDIQWQDENETWLSLKNYPGKVVMLNFWASWCAPCIKELPSIDRLHTLSDKKLIKIIALNIDRGGKLAGLRIIKKLNLKQLKFYWDKDNSVPKKLKIRAIPTTIVFDGLGREIGRISAAVEWDKKTATDLLRFFIDNPNYLDRLPKKRSILEEPRVLFAPKQTMLNYLLNQ